MALPALAATVVVLVALASIDPSVLGLLPVLALALVLALRRYPGEGALLALARRRRHEAARGISPTLRRVRCWTGPAVPRGGLLLACSLANRPPPGAPFPAR